MTSLRLSVKNSRVDPSGRNRTWSDAALRWCHLLQWTTELDARSDCFLRVIPQHERRAFIRHTVNQFDPASVSENTTGCSRLRCDSCRILPSPCRFSLHCNDFPFLRCLVHFVIRLVETANALQPRRNLRNDYCCSVASVPKVTRANAAWAHN